ncbi:hypothetical protein [Flammeovirga pacifica]|uniref:Uncharacterized protein n=1 Tax=Flammeovirga pacifica TaxID=915059 RepID=A0A1S1YVB7_FLAPC|nr:hypothetical protein [Flammeovirga pacifica]OHX64969.1 hypothetical protein NH26_00700 [Flammeovirga pacifica]
MLLVWISCAPMLAQNTLPLPSMQVDIEGKKVDVFYIVIQKEKSSLLAVQNEVIKAFSQLDSSWVVMDDYSSKCLYQLMLQDKNYKERGKVILGDETFLFHYQLTHKSRNLMRKVLEEEPSFSEVFLIKHIQKLFKNQKVKTVNVKMPIQ